MVRSSLAVVLTGCLLAVQSPAPEASHTETADTVFHKVGCIIYPLRKVTVSTQATGVIVEMPVEEGDVVKAKQLIAQLDDTLAGFSRDRLKLMAEEGHSLKEAKIRQEQAKEDYETAQKLAGHVRAAEVRAAARKYRLAQAIVEAVGHRKNLVDIELKQAQKRLEDHRICSPIDGVVMTKHRERGESVDADAQTPLVTLIDVSKLRAEVLMPVDRITAVRRDQRATVTCEVFPERTIEGRVVLIEPVVHPEVSKFKVKVEFTDPTGTIRPGMRAAVTILADK